MGEVYGYPLKIKNIFHHRGTKDTERKICFFKLCALCALCGEFIKTDVSKPQPHVGLHELAIAGKERSRCLTAIVALLRVHETCFLNAKAQRRKESFVFCLYSGLGYKSGFVLAQSFAPGRLPRPAIAPYRHPCRQSQARPVRKKNQSQCRPE